MRLTARYVPIQVHVHNGTDAQADLAPGKQRLSNVKQWIHEALYGHPDGYIPPPGGLADTQRDKLRRYRVSASPILC